MKYEESMQNRLVYVQNEVFSFFMIKSINSSQKTAHDSSQHLTLFFHSILKRLLQHLLQHLQPLRKQTAINLCQ